MQFQCRIKIELRYATSGTRLFHYHVPYDSWFSHTMSSQSYLIFSIQRVMSVSFVRVCSIRVAVNEMLVLVILVFS